jgi:long-chain acyl-CoA synthetase
MVDLASTLGGHTSSTALIEGELRVTYAELNDLVLRTAAGLRDRGLTSGARVAVAADPTVDGVVAFLGVQAAGLVPAMVSPRAPVAEFERCFDHVDPALLLIGTDRSVDLPGGIEPVRPAGTIQADLERADSDPVGVAPCREDDPAVVLYTSGVAGHPRPVVLTHRNLTATCDGLIAAPGSGLDSATVALCALPISHVYGLNSILSTVLRAGGAVVLVNDTEAELVGELVARHRVTALPTVAAMWKSIAAVGDPALFRTVVRATYSAAPMSPRVLATVREALGLRLVGGFGMTETAGTICQDDPLDPAPGSLGRPLGDTELRVVDGDGHDVLPGDYGELLLRGPSLTRQYLDGTDVDIGDEGWFRTGDLAAFDDAGRMTIVDRSKDVINIGGFNVSPAEVETVLDEHPAVAGSVVVRDIEDDREVIVAHVSLIADGAASPAQLTEHCRDQLSRYKVPTRIIVHDELPVTEAGKAVRRLLVAS